MKQFKLKTILFIAMSGIICSSCSDSVTETEPYIQNVQTYSVINEIMYSLKKHDGKISSLSDNFKDGIAGIEQFHSSNTRTNNEDVFYVINFKNGGYSIVSDKSHQVYAFSNQGTLHLDDTIRCKPLSWYINSYMPLINSTSQSAPEQKDSTLTDFNEFIVDNFSEPLITGVATALHQLSPFNKYCYTPSGKQAYAGCGPIASVTIMSYFKWPKSYNGYTFNWEAMSKDKFDDGWPRIIEIVGRPKLLNETYGASDNSDGLYGSWNNYSLYPVAFKEMGYADISSSSFDLVTIKAYLKSGQPILTRGIRNLLGHAWVIDGGFSEKLKYPIEDENGKDTYLESIYLHCLWGLETKSGYFLYKNNTLASNSAMSPGFENMTIYYNFKVKY